MWQFRLGRYGLISARIMMISIFIGVLSGFTASPKAFGRDAASKQNILVFGDSLSAGYGLDSNQAWPVLLQHKLNQRRMQMAQQVSASKKLANYNVINVSVSGETTAGGRYRLMAALKRAQPTIVILELGANDGLRGLPLDQMKENLLAMTRQIQKSGAKIILLGMRLPPNYGAYAKEFAAVFPAVAKRAQVSAFLDFLFVDLEDSLEHFQPDRLHPTASAQPILLDSVWSKLAPILE